MAFDPGRPLGSALGGAAEVEAARRLLDAGGLRRHPTPEKDWDLALFHARLGARVGRSGRILDAGCAASPLLRNLGVDGWTDLWGIDFALGDLSALRHPAVTYLQGNLLRAPFPDAAFDAVACQSVLEHGCPPRLFFAEMARLLRPGGVLLLSTDYWPRWQPTWGVPREETFGLPWRIFSAGGMRRLRAAAAAAGLAPSSEWSFGANERLVRWNGKRYTFFAAELERVA